MVQIVKAKLGEHSLKAEFHAETPLGYIIAP